MKSEKDFPPLTGIQIEHWNQLGHRSFSIRSSLSMEIISEREHELSLDKINLISLFSVHLS
ncbi:MAG: hypothetical protein ABSH41_16125 [Syntrophobacteraceae bacterium]